MRKVRGGKLVWDLDGISPHVKKGIFEEMERNQKRYGAQTY